MITLDLVMPTGGSHGGVENVVKSWVRGLDPKLFDIRVFHISPGKEDYLEGYKKQWVLPLPDDVTTLTVKYCAEAYIYFLQELGAPDLCIAVWIPMLSKACAVARNALKLNMPIISWIHNSIESLERVGWGGIHDMMFADAHLCISKQTANALLAADSGAPVFIIGNPITYSTPPDYSPDGRTLCFVARLVPEKKCETVLHALSLAKDKDWKLLVAGDGPSMDGLQHLCADLHLNQQVSFLGWKKDPWNICSHASALIIASDYEGFTLTALEASGIGMTVISTPVSGCVDYLVPGQNGFFFDHDDAQGLANILNAISEDQLSFCEPAVCRDSVLPYTPTSYFLRLTDILRELHASSKNIQQTS